MAFANRIRLPFELTRPQFPRESERFRFANGETKTLSTIIRKVYEGRTDELTEKLHEALVVAFGHDNVSVEGDKYLGQISVEDAYDINWSEFLNRPIAQATFKAEVTPFDASNSNCGTCEEYSQVVAEDDDLGDIDEDQTYVFSVIENDSICCSPITVIFTYLNPDYVDSASVDNAGNHDVTMTIKPVVSTLSHVLLGVYRVICDNGFYDEANVFANVTGTGAAVCQPPNNLQIVNITDINAQATWDAPSPAPASYTWELYLLSDQGTPIGTDTTPLTTADLDGLQPATQYIFFVSSNCDDIESSDYIFIEFTTQPSSGNPNCGSYEILNNTPTIKAVSYTDCNGNTASFFIPGFQQRTICVLQFSPGNPVDLNPGPGVVANYLGLC